MKPVPKADDAKLVTTTSRRTYLLGLGPPLPGDLGPAIVKSQQPVTPAYAPPGYDPEDARRKEANAAAASTVFFRSGNPGKAGAPASAQVAAAGPA